MPMIPDRDIYRSANVLVKQHGADAPTHVAMRADAMLAKGDLAGYAVWKRTLRAVGGHSRSRAGVAGGNPAVCRGHAAGRETGGAADTASQPSCGSHSMTRAPQRGPDLGAAVR